MNFDYTDKVKALLERLRGFMDEHIYPNEKRFYHEIENDRWAPTKVIEELKPKARAAGLWNLFLPDDENGAAPAAVTPVAVSGPPRAPRGADAAPAISRRRTRGRCSPPGPHSRPGPRWPAPHTAAPGRRA